MKIDLAHYALIGFLSVFFAQMFIGNFMQKSLITVHSRNPAFIFMTKTASQEGRQFGPRVFTMWNLSHILYYAIGSYIFPDLRLELWLMGLLWELLEIPFNTSNLLDLFWNAVGILIGALLRKI